MSRGVSGASAAYIALVVAMVNRVAEIGGTLAPLP